MKNKLTLLALACGLSFAAKAQVAEQALLKPIAGDKTLEASIRLDGATSTTIRLRSFKSEKAATRYSFGVAYNHEETAANATVKELGFSFAPGAEKHFAGTSRLSPYLGLAVPLSYSHRRYRASEEDINNVDWGTMLESDKSILGLGLQGLAGADFYITSKFYVGIEAGATFEYKKHHLKDKSFKEGYTPKTSKETTSSTGFSTFTSGGLRVGFAF